MVGGAYILFKADTMTLQDLWTEFQSIIAGGLVGLYLLGFFTRRGDGSARWVSALPLRYCFPCSSPASGLGWLPAGVTAALNARFDSYYTGIARQRGSCSRWATCWGCSLPRAAMTI